MKHETNAATTMPSLKRTDGAEATHTPLRSSPSTKKRCRDVATTPLDQWLSPGGTRKRSGASMDDGGDAGQKLKMRNPSDSVPLFLDMNDASTSRQTSLDLNIAASAPLLVDERDSKKTEAINESVGQLKTPPEILYNLNRSSKAIKTNTNEMNESVGQLKTPPELLYNLNQSQKAQYTHINEKAFSQSSGECTQEIRIESETLPLFTQPTEDAASVGGASAAASAVGDTLPSVQTTEQTSVTASTSAHANANNASEAGIGNKQTPTQTEEDEFAKAIELSKQSADREAQFRAEEEEKQMQLALRLSAAHSNDLIELDSDDYRYESFGDFYKNLSREQFQQCFMEWSCRQAKGGIEEIERGSLVTKGNGHNDFRKGAAKADLGNQEKAQYGRLSVDALYYILDTLTGVEESGLPESVVGPIKAFMDIGMGIGVQVLQAGLVYGYKSRGIEIMSERFMLAKALLHAFPEYFNKDPPNLSQIQMHQGDFAQGMPDGCKDGEPDIFVRNFLLCKDLALSEQKSLVVFINNAEDVFDARSNDDGKSRSLDSYLGELFGNMQTGVRFVTLTSLAKYFDRKDWFREDVLELGPHCVSWSHKAQPCYVLTKLSDMWTCGDCSRETSVVDGAGRLQVECVYCTKKPIRATKRKRAGKNKKYTE